MRSPASMTRVCDSGEDIQIVSPCAFIKSAFAWYENSEVSRLVDGCPSHRDATPSKPNTIGKRPLMFHVLNKVFDMPHPA